MRLKSGLIAAALTRRSFAEGAMAAIARKGAEEAGALFVKVNRLDGTADLYGPAPQSAFGDDDSGERLFEPLVLGAAEPLIEERLRSEVRFDPDLWIVEIEDRAGRHFLPLVKPSRS